MEDESTRAGADDAPDPSQSGPAEDDDGAEPDASAPDTSEEAAGDWTTDGDWDPPNVERRASDDAQAVSVGYVDMDEVIEPGDVNVENAVFVALGVLGTVGLLFYIVTLAS